MDLFRDWMDSASCAGLPASWFFVDEDKTSWYTERREEKRLLGLQVCRVCPVRQDCLGFALTEKIGFGIWGGMTTMQRKRSRTKLTA